MRTATRPRPWRVSPRATRDSIPGSFVASASHAKSAVALSTSADAVAMVTRAAGRAPRRDGGGATDPDDDGMCTARERTTLVDADMRRGALVVTSVDAREKLRGLRVRCHLFRGCLAIRHNRRAATRAFHAPRLARAHRPDARRLALLRPPHPPSKQLVTRPIWRGSRAEAGQRLATSWWVGGSAGEQRVGRASVRAGRIRTSFGDKLVGRRFGGR